MQYPFLGIHVTIDITKPAGSRIMNLEVRCSDFSEDKYEKVIPNKDYTIVVPSYLVNAGDGYKVLKESHQKRVEGKLLNTFSNNFSILWYYIGIIETRIKKYDFYITGPLDIEAFQKYLKKPKNVPVTQELDNRIIIITGAKNEKFTNTATSTKLSALLILTLSIHYISCRLGVT